MHFQAPEAIFASKHLPGIRKGDMALMNDEITGIVQINGEAACH